MRVIGVDIGGANVKAADIDGNCHSRPFEIWKDPGMLAGVLLEVLGRFESRERVAVTMTAELSDCFTTKSEGVDFILSAVETAAAGAPIDVWQTGGEFVPPDVAREIPLLVAAANWHALATWAGRMVPGGSAMLIDIGTTTTDIVPLRDGVPVPVGQTDVERLLSGELVYTGVRRTPLCAVARSVPFREGDCPLAAELFATTLDVHLLLKKISEDGNDCQTANGRPATRDAAHDRLARMLCCDRRELSTTEARDVAEFLAATQSGQIASAIDRVIARQQKAPAEVLVSGSGAFLAGEIAATHAALRQSSIVSLNDALGTSLSEVACAFALARLAAERL